MCVVVFWVVVCVLSGGIDSGFPCFFGVLIFGLFFALFVGWLLLLFALCFMLWVQGGFGVFGFQGLVTVGWLLLCFCLCFGSLLVLLFWISMGWCFNVGWVV